MADGNTIKIIRGRRRTFALSWENGGFVCRVPYLAGDRAVRSFLKKNEGWMDRQLAEQARISEYLRREGRLSEAELAALKKAAKKTIPERVAHYAPLVGVSCGRISIRAQQTRWGSCSAKGNLNFNCLLMLAPPEVLDSIVVHELCHRLEMNHSPRFYAKVLKVFPEYRRWNRWLKENGPLLLARLPEP